VSPPTTEPRLGVQHDFGLEESGSFMRVDRGCGSVTRLSALA
jgi:hypothetical protein